jgi:hypothetical protein
VVSTGKGAEGLGAQGGKHLLLAETADSFLTAINAILNDAGKAAELVRCAAAVAEQHSWTAAAVTVRNALRELES